METVKYLDFELRIEKRGQRYLATVVHSPCGEASALFKLPFSMLEIENFILRMESTHRGMRRITTPEMQTVRQFGSRLFEAVFSDEIRACFVSSKNEAESQASGLRLKIRLDSPELINIPWEFLYDASLGRFLGLFEDTPIVRYIEVRERVQALGVKPPLSILVMIANPVDYPPLDVQREKENLQGALKDLIQAGLLTVTWVEKATLPALAETMLRERFHIFHYIGHGGFAEQSKDGILVLEDDQGQGQWVSGERLAYLLGNQPTLRLVILNACEGGRTSSDDPFAGVAMTLVRTGSVPAVVAMQLAITDAAAIAFGRGFFTALSVGKPVDAAVTQARLAIFASGNDVEWGTPVLYMRSPDGRIFDIQGLSQPEPEQRRSSVETALEEAERAEKLQAEQAQAEALIRQEQEAVRKKADEERQAQLGNLYTQSLTRLNEEDWAGAAEMLEKILEMQPGYLNAVYLLKKARDEQDRARQQAEDLQEKQEAEERVRLEREARQAECERLYIEANNAVNAKQWTRAIEIYEGILKLDPGYRNALALLGQVRQLFASEEAGKQRQEQCAQSYAHALEHFQAQRWQAAIQAFQAVLEVDPGYSNPQFGAASDLLARAQQEKERSELSPPVSSPSKAAPVSDTDSRARDEQIVEKPIPSPVEQPVKPSSLFTHRFWRGLVLVLGISLLNILVSSVIQSIAQGGMARYFFIPFTALSSILLGPWVGGFVSLLNSLSSFFFMAQQRSFPWSQVWITLPIPFLFGMIPGLLVKDARKWKSVLAVGLLLGGFNLLSSSLTLQNVLNVLFLIIGVLLPYLILLPLLAWLLAEPVHRWGWYWRDLHPQAGSVNKETVTPVLLLSMGWCLAWGIPLGIGYSSGNISFATSIAGSLSGLACWLALGWKTKKVHYYSFLLILFGWTIGMEVAIDVFRVLSWNGPLVLMHWSELAVAGLIGGGVTALVLRWVKIIIHWQQVLTITGGWAAAMVLGQLLAIAIVPWLVSGAGASFTLRYFVTGLLTAALGSGIMFWVLGRNPSAER